MNTSPAGEWGEGEGEVSAKCVRIVCLTGITQAKLSMRQKVFVSKMFRISSFLSEALLFISTETVLSIHFPSLGPPTATQSSSEEGGTQELTIGKRPARIMFIRLSSIETENGRVT